MKDTVFKIIDRRTKGVDTYHNHGSTWLIFTDEKKWVIELTKDGTLWYNYYFFQDCLKYVSLDVVKNQHYITEWVENFIQNGVKEPKHNTFEDGLAMEDAIQNGVKETTPGGYLGSVEMKGKMVHQFESPKQNNEVEDAIQNGVKEIRSKEISESQVNRIIKNGVKEIKEISDSSLSSEIFKVRCNQPIRDGVKRTELGGKDRKIDEIKDIVKNGIKETKCVHIHNGESIESVIKDGIKETKRLKDENRPQIGNIIKQTNWRKVEHFPDYTDRITKQYNEIENLIIRWNNDGTKTAGELTRQIMGLLKKG